MSIHYSMAPTGWYFPREPTNFVSRKFLEPQEILESKSQIIKILDGYRAYSIFKVTQSENIYNSTTIGNISRVKLAVYHVNLTGNLTDSNAVHRKPRENYRPGSSVHFDCVL